MLSFHRNVHIWLLSYLKHLLRFSFNSGYFHIIFTMVDHFEPYWNGVNSHIAMQRVSIWKEKLPKNFSNFKDSFGSIPKYNFFYPQEEYDPDILNYLSDICHMGYGDVEIHLHHDNDSPDNFKHNLLEFKKVLFDKHDLLRENPKTNEIVYGFIHGNWALCNSRKDGKWCGINDELKILKETGCYADFTMPSSPSETQSKKINSIYYAKSYPDKPKGYNYGIDVRVGGKETGDLMLIQGPLALNWSRRKWKIFPKIENAEIAYNNPPTMERIKLWVKQHIHVKGRPEWVFIKVHTHGAQEKNIDFLLNGGLQMLFTNLQKYAEKNNYKLHYVTAWEMYNIIKAAEAGHSGNPSDYKNFLSTT